MRNPLSLVALLFMMLPLSCDKDRENPVPYVYVDFSIPIDGTQFIELNTIGGYAYFSGGHMNKGIIVYRAFENEFKAYDRSCPFDPFNANAIIRIDQDWLATCRECGSTYELNYGSVIDGPSRHPLREYRTFFNPPYLQVTSY